MEFDLQMAVALIVLLAVHSLWSRVTLKSTRRQLNKLKMRHAKTNAELNKVLPLLGDEREQKRRVEV